ncbi:MAG: flagellar hook protein FlgE [Burkholderiales bacterium]|nr:flagellar hook protein FlgE [Burkholderiales bacterium]
MSFQQGLSGLNAAAKNLDVVGNNVANASTVGFKSSTAQFADVFANSLAGAGGVQVGIGTTISRVNQNFTQGNISTTANALDIAINGKGFFRMNNNGAITYQRNGQFMLDNAGYVVNATGQRLTGYPPAPGGGVITATPQDLRIDFSDIPPSITTLAQVVSNLDSRMSALNPALFNMNDATTYSSATSLTTYDTLGNPHTLTLYYLKTAANTWDVFGANDGVQLGAGALGTVTFNPDGSLAAGANIPISAPVTTGAVTPMAYTVDLTGTTQFGSNFGVNQLTQDGYSSGRIAGYSVAADGMMLARYTNGQSRTLGQVALADFVNPQGLQPLGNNQWAETPESGQPLVGAPDSASLGVLQSGAVEDSNIDLTAELVSLITAQRVYQANAQTIRAQDQILQTLVNLR